MLSFIIPPAKEMELPFSKSLATYPQVSTPVVDILTSLSSDELAQAYQITPPAAEREYHRWQAIAKQTASAYPALLLYHGLMYRQIAKEKLSTELVDNVDKSLFIATSLYGIIPALMPIVPHRLDFQTRVTLANQQTLKNYWRPHYDSWADSQETVVSLLSSEFEDVFSPNVRSKFIRLDFLEEVDGRLKKHATISKKARGAFINQVFLQDSHHLEDLKTITADGFIYRPDLSTGQTLVYVRNKS
ncbi:peroxide stress protein YaaA [Streptococcus sp. DD12]|uniref:peroxide stress protein YaaA n=1 Tax=Streptococcus sp. DD12 TaxID=1777880 RepID=UPI0007929DF3|nr:peroxide stress protein YaaA [Streptococcus sp. DD12]KXT76054.1 UPF0246 protein YaaA [Streptococcus sp. DD12]